MRIPLGVDISEVWSVDFCAEAARQAIETWEAVLARAEAGRKAAEGDAAQAAEGEKKAAAEKAIAEAKKSADLAREAIAAAKAEAESYQAGSGPTVTIGHIPGAKRAEIAGMLADERKATTERERRAAEHAWRREVVRWAVRGHTGLRLRDGTEQAFDGVEVTIAGEVFRQPTERQIERYAQAGMLYDLAGIALAPQGLGGAEKNG